MRAVDGSVELWRLKRTKADIIDRNWINSRRGDEDESSCWETMARFSCHRNIRFNIIEHYDRGEVSISRGFFLIIIFYLKKKSLRSNEDDHQCCLSSSIGSSSIFNGARWHLVSHKMLHAVSFDPLAGSSYCVFLLAGKTAAKNVGKIKKCSVGCWIVFHRPRCRLPVCKLASARMQIR